MAECTDIPRLEREYLLEDYLEVSRAHIISHPEQEISDVQHTRLNNALAALRNGEPLAYILGERDFWGLSFSVNADVLIPRPDTELLVELTLAQAKENAHVIDLGTGSGAIAIALKKTRPDLNIVATDQSINALSVAKENANKHDVSITFKHSNWFKHLDPENRWDIVISNPPYIADSDPHLPDLKFEPHSALVSGPTGLDDLKMIIHEAPRHMADNALLLVEHGFDQADAVRAQLKRAGFCDVQSHLDLAHIERVSGGRIGKE